MNFDELFKEQRSSKHPADERHRSAARQTPGGILGAKPASLAIKVDPSPNPAAASYKDRTRMDKVLLDTTPSYLPSARRDPKKARLTESSQSSELAAASAWTAAAKETLPPGFFMDRNGFQQRCTLQIQNQQVQ